MSKNTPKTATAADVRAWFAETMPANVPAPGSRGRLSPEIREAFHEATGREYVQGTKPEVQKVSVTYRTKSGRKASKSLPVAEVRALAGQATSTRGRLSQATIARAGEALTPKA